MKGMENIQGELLQLIPSILWFLLGLVLIILFYRPLRYELLPNLSGFKAMGVEFSFVQESIEAAIELAEKSPKWKVEISRADKERALSRARNHLSVFKGAQILWVDDHPENNLNERRMLRQLNTEIDMVTNSEEALRILDNAKYDVVLSDMARGQDPLAGLDFLQKLREFDRSTPVIFYIGVIDLDKGVPGRAFGITNRPDELLHLILDVLERKSY
jgi:CheY-like chemotaxis protein